MDLTRHLQGGSNHNGRGCPVIGDVDLNPSSQTTGHPHRSMPFSPKTNQPYGNQVLPPTRRQKDRWRPAKPPAHTHKLRRKLLRLRVAPMGRLGQPHTLFPTPKHLGGATLKEGSTTTGLVGAVSNTRTRPIPTCPAMPSHETSCVHPVKPARRRQQGGWPSTIIEAT